MKAIVSIEAEVFVVDNCSSDGSIEYLAPLFPTVTFIKNQKNAGFAKANNRALQKCCGQYVLFLNPDTLVPEDCFDYCIRFFENNNLAGGVGVRMVDGNGRFLPESKRSYPTCLAALFKLTGIATIFPDSKIFNRYALGHLDKNNNHEVDILAGAFMMLRSEVLVKTGGFDESFFMYGEDIDLSYRIQLAGFKNYYLGKNYIIHFKGESTPKNSLMYTRLFYKAMNIFVHKHAKEHLRFTCWVIEGILVIKLIWLEMRCWGHLVYNTFTARGDVISKEGKKDKPPLFNTGTHQPGINILID